MAHALVFGASGISGWAVTKEALSYPNNDSFAKVTALTNRPLSLEDSKLSQDGRLQLASGINLLSSPEEVAAGLKEKVKSPETISHVFFNAYVDPGTGYEALREQNTRLLSNAILGVLKVTQKLQSVILQTGGKGYGVEFVGKVPFQAPLKESLPRIPQPYYENVFYYFQYDALKELSAGQSWTFTEVRPDVIIGFVPGTNVMNCAQGLGFYLSLYRAVHGEGAEVPFPGSQGGWTCKHTDTSQDILARFEIFAATHPESCGNGRAFNVADGAVTTWEQKWPGICADFGLVGKGPSTYEPLSEFVSRNKSVWDELVKKHGLKTDRIEAYDWNFLFFVMDQFAFDREYDLSAIRSAGFDESIDTVQGYKTAFGRMRAAKVIP